MRSIRMKMTDMLHPDVIVVDPPRKGCDEKCLETMLLMKPERIVYVSCDSATLARDLKVLAEGGYEVKRVRAVDQFAHTTHVECVTLLQRKDILKILEFRHFVEFFSFNKIGENHREKELVRKVTVVAALDLGCWNTKNSEYESK